MLGMVRLLLAVLIGASVGASSAARAEEGYDTRFVRACESGPLIEILLAQSFTADRTRSAFCGCFIAGIGDLSGAEQDFVVRTLEHLESNPDDRERFDGTGRLVEAAFDGCVASQGLRPPSD